MGREIKKMRIVLTCLGLLLSVVSAQAGKIVVSGKPLILYQAWATNPDCTSAGAVVLRVAEGPEHGRISIRPASLFPRFSDTNPRSICNRRRVPGMQAMYVLSRV